MVQVDLSGISVFIAMPTTRGLPAATVRSLLHSDRLARDYNIPVTVLFEVDVSDVELARSICVHRFLKEESVNRLFWIDSDMKWSPDSFMRMLALSTKVDVVCGSYPRKSDPLTFLSGTPGWVEMNELGCVPFSAGGLGFTVCCREVIKTIAERAPALKIDAGDLSGEDVRMVFRKGEREGKLVSEDVAFLRDVREAGFEIWCDPRMVLGHIGTKIYEGSLYQFMQKRDDNGIADGMRQQPREEAVLRGSQRVDEACHD